ncbi:MAG: hypothetical protein ACM34D_08340 [Gemmatimonadota bacterium]
MPEVTDPADTPSAGRSPTTQLRAAPQTLGHETNLARAPLWNARSRSVQPDLFGPTVLYGHEFRQIAGERLTLSDQRLFTEFTTAYTRAGFPDNRRVPFSLGEGARLLGHHETGGKQRGLVQASLTRLRSCTIKSAVRYLDDRGAVHEDVLLWGLVDSTRTTTRGGGRGLVTLSEQVADLLKAGSVTLLHAPTWDAILREDQLAARLWCFLEAEDLRRGWRYQLFAGTPGGMASGRNMPALAELLCIDEWSNRRRVALRVREMCRVIGEIDPRYRLELVKGKETGMWRLEVGPRGPHRSVPIRGFAGVSRLVLGAWQHAYGDRRPSKKQVLVLRELTERLGSAWVATHLPVDHADPFAALLAAAADRRSDDLDAAARREREWAADKARFQHDIGLAALVSGTDEPPAPGRARRM